MSNETQIGNCAKRVLKNGFIMNTDEMLQEIVSWKYKSYGFPYVFMDYSQHQKKWSITWRNPANFTNDECRNADTPKEACEIALDFIRNNPMLFSKIGF